MNKQTSQEWAFLAHPRAILKTPAHRFLWTVFKAKLFQWLTRDSPPLFLRGADVISVAPHILGVHEPQVKAALDLFADNGFDGFLVDIGANIGLTSCQSGAKFHEIHMYEPNPLCAGILRVNAAIALVGCNYEIHEYGLGQREEKLPLQIPKNNWGGAYIESDQNTYSIDTLAKKDGFPKHDPENYLSVEIQVKQAGIVLGNLFNKLHQTGATKGTVKIDVEGLELVVLNAIAHNLPKDMSTMVIFENWGTEFKFADILEAFRGRAIVYSLAKTPAGAKTVIGKLLALLYAGQQQFTLKRWEPSDEANDVILCVRETSSVSPSMYG